MFEAEHKADEDMEMGSIFKRDLASLHCPVAIKMQTASSGFWQVCSTLQELTNLEHFPPLVHSTEKKQPKKQPVQELLTSATTVPQKPQL
jgi:hypothetical protein